MYVAPAMSHACSAFAVGLFVWTWWKVRRSWSIGGAVGLGACGGLMAMVREQDLFFLAGPVLDLAWTWLGAWRASAAHRSPDAGPPASRAATSTATPSPATLLLAAVAMLAAMALALLPQLAAYQALNGYPGPSRLVRRKMSWMAPHALEVLASPSHGLLVWTPLVALSLAGLCVLWWRAGRADTVFNAADRRRFGACALLMFALQVYVAGSVESWTVAGAFGQRRFVGTTILLVVGLGATLAAVRTRALRSVTTAVILAMVWWNLGLVAQFGAGLMDRQRLEPARNAYTTFVVLPVRLPELAWRYLFDRASFYKPPGGRAPAASGTPATPER
jgi:hypothetical protein